MVSRNTDTIDFNKLEDEVHSAVEADERYWRENDAKFRAVNQKVATYEEFRDVVLAAHLKPFEKDDRLDNIRWNQPWNQPANTSTKGGSKTETMGTDQKLHKKPMNGHEFARDWRRHCKISSDKYSFLLWLGEETITKVFKAEISFGLLGDILTAIDKEYQSRHCYLVAAILEALTHANRFKLSVDFLSAGEKEACERILDRIVSDIKEDKLVDSSESEQIDKESVISSMKEIDEHNLEDVRLKYGIGK